MSKNRKSIVILRKSQRIYSKFCSKSTENPNQSHFNLKSLEISRKSYKNPIKIQRIFLKSTQNRLKFNSKSHKIRSKFNIPTNPLRIGAVPCHRFATYDVLLFNAGRLFRNGLGEFVVIVGRSRDLQGRTCSGKH